MEWFLKIGVAIILDEGTIAASAALEYPASATVEYVRVTLVQLLSKPSC